MFDAVVHDIAAALRPTGASGEHGSGRQAERTRDVR
jgi:hypothetical protein